MGHFYTEVTAIGKDREEAQHNAIGEFLHEEGSRHSIREVLNPELIEKVPPNKQVTTRCGPDSMISFVPDYNAPKEKWLEKWKFTIHSHA